MNRSRFGVIAAVVLALSMLALPSCGGPTYVVQQYGGPKRATETIAIVRFAGKDDAKLVVIDGERADVALEEDARLHIEVLPGEHTLGVVSADKLQAPLSMVSFRAEAGKTYGVAFVDGSSRARVFEIDSRSDARLRDVTLDKTAAPEERPRPPPPVEPQPSDLPAPPPSAVDGGDSGLEQAEP